ncbi:MBL fold metallo-hydrolase [Alistipes sp.]|uniref:MBL fold metallo-hydrolase n=1 Tax=Alistipes sp. TaxID=1872444 RepID=UPI0011C80799
MKTILLMSLFIFAFAETGGANPNVPHYPADSFTARDGTPFTITFFKHASLAIEVDGKSIYIDPVDGYAAYDLLPKADLVLITHSHYDHLDPKAIARISTSETQIVCDKTSAQTLGPGCEVVTPGQTARPRPYAEIEAVRAYNTSQGHTQFHPRDREDNGYILTIGGTRIYIAGDSENTPEMKALRNIDIAFLSVNQPYTMTVDQAVDAVKAIRPAIFYPYHTGETAVKTDLDRLQRELEGVTEIRIRPME